MTCAAGNLALALTVLKRARRELDYDAKIPKHILLTSFRVEFYPVKGDDIR